MNSVESAQFGAANRTNNPRKPQYLARRSGTYYFKRKVPRDAAKAFPRARSGTFWKSLRTSDEDQAKAALVAEVWQFERRIEKALQSMTSDDIAIGKARRRSGGTDKYLLREHIPVILAAYRAEVLLEDDRERARIGKDVSLSLEQKLELAADRGRHLAAKLMTRKQAAAWQSPELVDAEVSELLKQHGLIAPPGQRIRSELNEELLRLEIEILGEQLSRLQGEGKTRTPSPSVATQRARSLLTLRDAHAGWAVGKTKLKTIDTYDMVVAEFEAQAGAIPLIGLTHHHAAGYRDWLMTKRLSRATASNRVKGLATLFDHARRNSKPEDLIANLMNPFRSLSLERFSCGQAWEARRPFSMAELQTIFASELYASDYKTRGQAHEALYWSLPIGVYAGPRIEELAQLRSNDIERVEGTWVFSFREQYPDQKLKNRWSVRRVPVHRELARIGFVDYVLMRQQDALNPMLFPSLANANKYRSWSSALSKSIGRYLDKIGLSDPRLDYHSFRYVFRQQCANCGVGHQEAERLLGHWQEGDESAGVYLKNQGLTYPLPALVTAMNAVQYTELDLSQLAFR
jgi:hypothetical protein